MATREEMAQALTTAANGWNYEPRSSESPLRRLLFQPGDTFFFSFGECGCDCRLFLRAVGGDEVLVLGADLALEWNSVANAYTVTAYGRRMEFSAAPANTTTGWAMVYNAEYEAPPHNSPDEGGDGDPK